MTEPKPDVPEDRATDVPVVSTAPPTTGPRRWWSAVPAHLGRARTSTVVLAVLFLAIGFLYLNVRPAPVGSTPTGGGGGMPGTTEQPAPTTAPSPTPTPTEEPAPTTTAPAPTTEEEPTPTEEVPETDEPTSTPTPTPPTTGSPPAPPATTAPTGPTPTTPD